MAKTIFEEMGGKYERQGDYLIPCLTCLLYTSLGTAAGTVFADICGSGHDAGIVGYHLCHLVWPNGRNISHRCV